MLSRQVRLRVHRADLHLSRILLYDFFFNDTPTPDIYTLSLHDALPISSRHRRCGAARWWRCRSRAVRRTWWRCSPQRSEEHTSELQSLTNLVCRLLLEKKKTRTDIASGFIVVAAIELLTMFGDDSLIYN